MQYWGNDLNSLNFVSSHSSMVDSSMSKPKLGPQESEENGKLECVIIKLCMVWMEGLRSNAVSSYFIRNIRLCRLCVLAQNYLLRFSMGLTVKSHAGGLKTLISHRFMLAGQFLTHD